MMSALFAQDPPLEKNPLRGFFPTGSYSLSDIETINNVNGNVILRTPIASLPSGRGGLSAGVSLIYNSKLWEANASVATDCLDTTKSPTTTYDLAQSANGGWHYGVGFDVRRTQRSDHFTSQCALQCPDQNYYHNWKTELIFPDGSAHPLTPRGYEVENFSGYFNRLPDGRKAICSTGPGDWIPVADSSPNSYYTTDGTFARLDVNTTDTFQWTLSFADGRRVKNVLNGSQYEQRIFDRNGDDCVGCNQNYIRIGGTYDSTTETMTTTLSDPLGRSIAIWHGGNQDTVTATGFGTTGPLTWTVTWINFTSTRTYRNYDTPPNPPPPPQTLHGVSAISKISLPPQLGTLSYTFDYGQNAQNVTAAAGELQSITLPTGAKAQYTFNLATETDTFPYFAFLENTIVRKDLIYSGITETWNYALSGSGGITAPDGGVTVETANGDGLVFKTVHPDGTKIERIWNENPTGSSSQPAIGASSQSVNRPLQNPFVSVEYTSYANQSGTPTGTEIKHFSYDKSGNLLQQQESDWVLYSALTRATDGEPSGPFGSTLRTTTSTYNGPAPVSGNVCLAGFYCDPSAARVLNQLNSRQVTGIGSGSKNQYCYDATGNVTVEASWDSTKGGLPAALVTCSSQALDTAAIGVFHTYDSYGNQLSLKDARGTTTLFYFGAVGGSTGPTDLYPTQIIAANGASVQQTTSRDYDLNTGVVTTVTDPNSVITATTYDAFGRPTLVTQAGGTSAGHQTSMEYSDTNLYAITRSSLRSESIAASNGPLVSVQRFDPLGRLRLKQVLENAPEPAGLATNETAGTLTQYKYAFIGTNGYHLVSNPYRTTSDPTMGWTQTRLDNMGRAIQVQSYGGSALPAPWPSGTNSNITGTVTSGYDVTLLSNAVEGVKATVTDQALAKRSTFTDSLGRLAKVVEDPDASAYVTSYSYDVLNDLTGVCQGSGCLSSRTFNYSSLKRLTSAINPESGTMSYLYDANGNLTSKTDPRLVVTAISYDELNRPLRESYSGGPATVVTTPATIWCYDGDTINHTSPQRDCTNAPSGSGKNLIGRVTRVSNGTSTTEYGSYDALGRVLATTQDSLYPFVYTYVPAGLRTMRYPSGRVVTTSYDDAGRPLQLAAGTKNYASAISYAPHGAPVSVTLGNNLVETTGYNPRLQALTMNLGSVWGITNDYGTSNNNNGNLMSQQITAQGMTGSLTHYFRYDGLNRLLLASENPTTPSNPVCQDGGSQWCQGFSYQDQSGANGQLGNRWVAQSSNIGTVTGQPANFNPANNRITDSGYGYDGAGNLNLAPTGFTFAYDAENRLAVGCPSDPLPSNCVNTAANGRTLYGYDGNGKRVTKQTPDGTVTTFVYDAMGGLAAEYSSTPVTPAVAGTIYLTTDHLGSTRVVTDSSATPVAVARHDYRPFGEEISFNASNPRHGVPGYAQDAGVRQEFTGKQRDAETGLDYFGARYMSGAQGRFTSVDPIVHPANSQVGFEAFISDPQRWNKYAYALNNTLKYVDPDGAEAGLCYRCGAGGQTLTPLDPGYPQSAHPIRDTLIMGAATVGVLMAPEVALGAAARALFTGIFGAAIRNPDKVQQAAAIAADAIAPPGTPSFSASNAAANFGFKTLTQTGANEFVGRFSNGANMLVNLSKEGSNLNVTIPFLTKISAETMRNVEKGAISAARAEGASTVTIIGAMVKDKIVPLLKANGFIEKDGMLVKEIPVQ